MLAGGSHDRLAGRGSTFATGRPGSTAGSPAPSSASASTAGDVGRTFDVVGQTTGEKLAITLIAVDQSARTANEDEKPEAGGHYVAVEFGIRNIGSTTYSDSVGNCDQVFDATNSIYSNTLVEPISSGPVLETVDIAPGRAEHGWSVFTLPIGTTIASVTYTPDSAFDRHTVQWRLR